VIQTRDGGFALTGYTRSYGQGWQDIIICRLDSACNPLWTTAIGREYRDVGYSLCETYDGGFVVSGQVTTPECDFTMVALKVDSSGNLVWAETIGIPAVGAASTGRQVMELPDSTIVIVGEHYSVGMISEPLLYQLYPNGDHFRAWSFRMPEPQFLGGLSNCLTRTSDGGFAIGGSATRYEMYEYPILPALFRYDSAGTTCLGDNMSLPINDTVGLIPTQPALVAIVISPTVSAIWPEGNAPEPEITVICNTDVGESEGDEDTHSKLTLLLAQGGFWVAGYSGPVSVYDATGRLILSRDIKGKTLVGPLNPGVYFVRAGKLRGKVAVR